jgi:hypothetical protein
MHTTPWLLSSSRLLALALWGMVSFQACGGDSEPQNAAPACGPGTALVNGQCVVATECGEGTVIKAGKCVPEAVAGQGGAAGSQSGSGGSGAGQGGAQTGGNDTQGGQGGSGIAGAGGIEAGAGSGVAGAEAGGAGGALTAGSGGVGQAGTGGSEQAGMGGSNFGGAEQGGMSGGSGSGGIAGEGGSGQIQPGVPKTCKGVPNKHAGCCGSDGDVYICSSAQNPSSAPMKFECSGVEYCRFKDVPNTPFGSFVCTQKPSDLIPPDITEYCTSN